MTRTRTARLVLLLPLIAVGLFSLGCSRSDGSADGPPAEIAVTNSYLAAVCRDLLGEDRGVLVLSGAGSCPGHFDVRPSQARAMRDCRLVLRFDFQQSLDAKLSAWGGRETAIAPVSVADGLCVPTCYLSACRQVAEAMVERDLLAADAAKDRLAEIERQTTELQAELSERVRQAGLAGTAVLASGHQAGFCRSLGLQVAGTFRGADQAGVAGIDRAIEQGEQAGVTLVIANRPEGRKLADALADRLDARVVLFGNFPGPDECTFAGLVRANVKRLTGSAEQ